MRIRLRAIDLALTCVSVGLVAGLVLSIQPVPAQAQLVGNAEAGVNVFKMCLACHRVGVGAKNGVGPVLNGIVDRKAGTYADYKYTPANQNSGLVWDVATLTVYLKAPMEKIPGTKMTFAGLKDPQQIADVIAYLAKFDSDGKEVAK